MPNRSDDDDLGDFLSLAEQEESLILKRRKRRQELLEELRKKPKTSEVTAPRDVEEGEVIEDENERVPLRREPRHPGQDVVHSRSSSSSISEDVTEATRLDEEKERFSRFVLQDQNKEKRTRVTQLQDQDKRSRLEMLHDKDKREAKATHIDDGTPKSEMLTTEYREVSEAPSVEQSSAVEKRQGERNGIARTVPVDQELDMFAETEEFDMFSAEAVPVQPTQVASSGAPTRTTKAVLADNWDDQEGYYRHVPGEMMDDRYKVTGILGRGVFSSVVKAVDTTTGKDVAIKLIRNNETLRKAGLKEIGLLEKIQTGTSNSTRYIIRLEGHFSYRNHLCLVFESMHMNLRELLKRFGGGVGLNIRAVRVYASQLLHALYVLQKNNVIHADIKPDNVLVNESRNIIKLCDLGSASDVSENEPTPYLCSRFYRAPEIILGMEYAFPLDMWAVGCTLYELYTGKILFPGRTNGHMLRLMMDLKGRFSAKMIRKGLFGSKFFDDGKFIDGDKLVQQPVAPVRDLRSRLIADDSNAKVDPDEQKMVSLFVDLLDRMLVLNPEKRITVKEALASGFISGAA